VQKILNLAQEHSYDGLTIEEREVEKDSPMAGRTLLQLELRGRYDAVVFAIIGSSQKIVHNPGPDTEVRAGDTLILLGPPDRLERLTTELKLK
jgi:K+/H+ antiporter YhaU regulatory subunit KhtT